MLETMDRLAHAFAREREAREQVWPAMEQDSTQLRVFRCVCCGRLRRDEARREPESEVCIQCVQAAGFQK